jgi:hypothetical protein
VAVDDGDALSRVIHKEFLARAMRLSHDEIELAGPGTVGVTKPTILQAIGRRCLLFLPQQEQGDTLAFEFVMDHGPSRHQMRRWGSGRAGGKQQPF